MSGRKKRRPTRKGQATTRERLAARDGTTVHVKACATSTWSSGSRG